MAGEKGNAAATPEELAQKVADLEAAVQARDQELAELATAHEKALEEQSAAHEKDLNQAMELNTELQDKLKLAGKTIGRPSFQRDGKTYEVVYPSIHMPKHKKTYKASDVVASKSLQEELIKMNSGAIRQR